jgi:hypothetical protein
MRFRTKPSTCYVCGTRRKNGKGQIARFTVERYREVAEQLLQNNDFAAGLESWEINLAEVEMVSVDQVHRQVVLQGHEPFSVGTKPRVWCCPVVDHDRLVLLWHGSFRAGIVRGLQGTVEASSIGLCYNWHYRRHHYSRDTEK